MKFKIALITINLLLCISCTTESTPESYLKIVDISPNPETPLTFADTITVTLDYSVSDEDNSNIGYVINILFSAKPEYGGYVLYSWSGFQFQSKRGKITIDFPLSEVSDNADKIIDPISLYFILGKRVSAISSEIIARTEEVAYK